MTDVDASAVPARTPKASTFKLSLTGEGITVNRTVAEHIAREIISMVMSGGTGTGTAPPGDQRQRPGTGQPSKSLREFLDEASAKKNPQIIAAVGQYLADQVGQDRFTRSDVKGRFSEAGERAPANFVRDFQLAVSSGWIAPDTNEKDKFFVTTPGRKAIKAGFAGQKIRRPTRRRQAKVSGVER